MDHYLEARLLHPESLKFIFAPFVNIFIKLEQKVIVMKAERKKGREEGDEMDKRLEARTEE